MLNIEIVDSINTHWVIRCSKVSLPTTMGRFQILPGHMPIISIVSSGLILLDNILDINKYLNDKNIKLVNQNIEFHIYDGLVECNMDKITIIGDIRIIK